MGETRNRGGEREVERKTDKKKEVRDNVFGG